MTGVLGELLEPKYDVPRAKSYVALDYPSWKDAEVLVKRFGDAVDGYKVGLQLFHADGQRALDTLHALGKRVFLDVKLHDIPNTVAGAIRSIGEYGVEMINVHAQGGPAMLKAAREAVDLSPAGKRPLIIAVTVLTSLSQEDLQAIGYEETELNLTLRLAKLTQACGLDGVVASAHEATAIRAQAGEAFEIVVPGIRLAGATVHDQARSMSPGAALSAGATRLVLGRGVTQASDPEAALLAMWDDMLGGL